VLVVDDEDVIRETVREILTDEGYRVIAALDGSEVLNLVAKEDPDVILLDVWMPEMDGIVLLKQIRRKKIPTLFFWTSGCPKWTGSCFSSRFGESIRRLESS
jgi:CheY-like chemotaxis protein